MTFSLIATQSLRRNDTDGFRIEFDMKVNYPAHRAGHLKKLYEGDCIPLALAPHSAPSTGRGILREDFIKRKIGALSPYFIYYLLFILFCLPITPSFAADEPFTGPANWGGTGLMETPTARVLKEGRFRIGASQIDPYRYYYGAVSPLKGLEIGGRITEVLDVPALMAGYGNYKDKSVDLKYQFLPEGKWWPAIAVGLMDPHGTRVYPSQYIVMSKQIYPFDFTVGFGNGRFGKKPIASSADEIKVEMLTSNSEWRSDGQFFGGVQVAVTDWLTLMAEYSPIAYEKQTSDPAQQKYFPSAVPSKFNFGLRLKPWDWAELDVSYQRGQQVGMNLSVNFELGNPLVPIYDHPYKEKAERRSNPLRDRIAAALYESGFMDIGVTLDGDDLRVEAENDKYYYQPRAISVALRALNDIAPPTVRRIHLTLTANRIPLVTFTSGRDDVALFFEEKLTVNEFYHISGLTTDVRETVSTVRKHEKFMDYGIKPEFRTFLNDPSGFFKYKLGVSGWVSYRPWRGSSFVVGPEYYISNTVSTSNAPSATAVRTDLVPYQQDNVALGMLLFEQIDKFKQEIYGRIAAGLLEIQYAGFDGEVAKPFFGGRLMVGLSGSVVKKREAGSPFKLKDNDYKDYYSTAFLNTRLNIPELEAAIDLKSGQFLAGDRGTRITVSKFFNGVVLSAWYSITDTSIFTDSFNRDYHDKGIALTIPFRLFKGSDSRTSYKYAVSAWTRDVAQDIDHYNSLFDYIGRNARIYLEKK
jgi:hypothetical protein